MYGRSAGNRRGELIKSSGAPWAGYAKDSRHSFRSFELDIFHDTESLKVLAERRPRRFVGDHVSRRSVRGGGNPGQRHRAPLLGQEQRHRRVGGLNARNVLGRHALQELARVRAGQPKETPRRQIEHPRIFSKGVVVIYRPGHERRIAFFRIPIDGQESISYIYD